jgi:hypothetical protein
MGAVSYQRDQNEEQWRQTRLIISEMYNTAGKQFKGTVKPTDVIKLPGDNHATQALIQQVEAQDAIIDQYLQQKNN